MYAEVIVMHGQCGTHKMDPRVQPALIGSIVILIALYQLNFLPLLFLKLEQFKNNAIIGRRFEFYQPVCHDST